MDILKIREEVRNILKKFLDDDLSELYLSTTFTMAPKPGITSKFPEENPEDVQTLNLVVDDGPHEFPEEEEEEEEEDFF